MLFGFVCVLGCVGVRYVPGGPGRSFCSHFLVSLVFARNEDSAQKAYKCLNQRNINAGRLFFRVASEVPSPPENAELFARDNRKLWAGDPKIWILSLDTAYKGCGKTGGLLGGSGTYPS